MRPGYRPDSVSTRNAASRIPCGLVPLCVADPFPHGVRARLFHIQKLCHFRLSAGLDFKHFILMSRVARGLAFCSTQDRPTYPRAGFLVATSPRVQTNGLSRSIPEDHTVFVPTRARHLHVFQLFGQQPESGAVHVHEIPGIVAYGVLEP